MLYDTLSAVQLALSSACDIFDASVTTCRRRELDRSLIATVDTVYFYRRPFRTEYGSGIVSDDAKRDVSYELKYNSYNDSYLFSAFFANPADAEAAQLQACKEYHGLFGQHMRWRVSEGHFLSGNFMCCIVDSCNLHVLCMVFCAAYPLLAAARE
jgi:hypothetical protein